MMHWPQYLVLGSAALSFAVHCKYSGEARSPFNPIASLVGTAISLSILIAGGFFAPFGWSF